MKMTKESLLKVIGAADDVISALAGTNDEFHKDDTDKMVRLWDDLNDQYAPPEVVRELARFALATMDSEPVAWTWHYREQWHVTNDERRAEFVAKDGDVAVLPLYRHAQTASEREQVRRQHAEWSQATFGNVGPVGPLKHLSKEALEAAADPHDPLEWADMQFLFWDAQRRMGISDEFITRAMVEKLAINKARQWPEPKDGEPRLHIKEQPAPVVSADLLHTAASAIEDLLEHTDPNTSYYSGVWADVPGKLRSAMLQARSLTSIIPTPAIGSLPKTGEVLHTNSPVIPDGYVMVPMRLTAENGAKGALSGEFSESKFVNCPECFGDDECETCDGSGRIEITVPVTWTTIKEIWAKGVEHFSATPREMKGE